MNDFTKEELELLWEHSPCLPGELRPFLDKVRHMIDNYCEHHWKKGQHLFTDIYCTKCKRILNEQPT